MTRGELQRSICVNQIQQGSSEVCATKPISRTGALAILSMFLIALVSACSNADSEIVSPAASNSAQPIPTIAPEVRDQRGTIVSSVQAGAAVRSAN